MKQDFPLWLGILFPVAFAGFWALILTIIAKFGWARLASRFRSDRPIPDKAQRFRWQSLTIGRNLGGPGYSNCVNVWIDAEAIHLRPSLLFRIGHPLLRLKWRDVASVEKRKMLFELTDLRMKHDVPPMAFSGRAGHAIIERWRMISGGSVA